MKCNSKEQILLVWYFTRYNIFCLHLKLEIICVLELQITNDLLRFVSISVLFISPVIAQR